MQAEVDEAVKTHVVHFLCSDKESGGLGSSAAIESLGTRTENGRSSHALHKAIDEGVYIDEKMINSKELKSCLKERDDKGMTCLHKTLTPPYTPCKNMWTHMLVEIDYEILQVESDSDKLTPLQHMIEVRAVAKTKAKLKHMS